MANHERGIYEPGNDVRVFDGAEEEDDIEGSRLPLMVVLALLVLAMFGGVVWLAYKQGVARGRDETPVLTAANGPEKVAPSQPGGANVPYQGFKIYEQPAPPDDSADTGPAANAPAPKPAAAAPVETPKPVPQPTVAAPVQAAPQPAPVKLVPPPAKPAPQPVAAAVKPEPKPVVKTAPPPLKPATATTTPAPKTMDALIQQANNLPATKPAPAAPVGGPATAAPRQLGAPVPAGGSAVLQIGAYKSQDDADSAWKAYKAKHALAAGYSEDVAKVDLGEKGTWYRLRMAGFSDKAQATAACDKLKADGGVCMLAK
jgi:outer membrane biosynthesis protein TonB